MPLLVLLNYVIAFAIGSVVSVGELISRYRDDPFRAVLSGPAGAYIAVNGLASAGALLLILSFGWEFGAPAGAVVVMQVLVAGFGAIALFRTSLFNVTAESEVIPIGPSIVLNVILGAVDRAVDRTLAQRRSEAIAEIMDGVPYATASQPLELYCLELMQNAQPADRAAVTTTIQSLDSAANATVPDAVKSYVLGLALLNIVGMDVLRDAVKRVRPHLADPDPAPDGPGRARRP